MNHVQGVNGYSRVGAMGAAKSQGAARRPEGAAAAGKQDEVQISSVARFLSQIAALPDIRAEKVEQVRQALAEGSYDVEGKLPAAITQMVREYLQK